MQNINAIGDSIVKKKLRHNSDIRFVLPVSFGGGKRDRDKIQKYYSIYTYHGYLYPLTAQPRRESFAYHMSNMGIACNFTYRQSYIVKFPL